MHDAKKEIRTEGGSEVSRKYLGLLRIERVPIGAPTVCNKGPKGRLETTLPIVEGCPMCVPGFHDYIKDHMREGRTTTGLRFQVVAAK